VSCESPEGTIEKIQWDEIDKIEIVTTSDGPFLPDVFWVLIGTEKQCVVPSGATGEKQLLTRLQALPGFHNEVLISAMSCTADRHFTCWIRVK